jgi:hypothetical protein
LLAWAFAAYAGRWVIEPGQEETLSAMLGASAALPAGCSFDGASIDKSRVTARYACPAGAASIELVHPSEAPPSARKTASFGLLPNGVAPPELVEAICQRVSARDASFHWTLEGRAVGHAAAEAPFRAPPSRVWLAAAAVALAFAVVLAVGLALAQRVDARAPTSSRLAPALWFAPVVAAVVTWALLERAFGAAPLHPDTIRDVLMADECLAGAACDHGPPTRLGLFVQGALWTRFLALCRASGVRVAHFPLVVHALDGLSAAIVLAAARRRLAPDIATWTAASWALLLPWTFGAPVLWNPSLAPLPLASFFAALVLLVDHEPSSPRTALGLGALAGLTLALVLECHVAFAVLVPVLLAAAASVRRPIHATASATCALTAGLLLDGRTAWIANARAVSGLGGVVPAAFVLVAALACGLAGRSRLLTVRPVVRSVPFLFTAGVLSTGAAIAVPPFAGAEHAARYLAPALAPLAVCGAWVFVRGTAALARLVRLGEAAVPSLRLALGVGTALAVLPLRARASAKWSLSDAALVAPSVVSRAGNPRALGDRLQVRSRTLLGAMALFRAAPLEKGDAKEDLVLLKQSRERPLPPGPWIAEVDLGASRALVGAFVPFVDRTRMQACYGSLNGAAEGDGCVAAHDEQEIGESDIAPEELAYPEARRAREAFPPETLRRFDGVHERFVARLAPRPGPPRVLVILAEDPSWTIESVSGVAYAGELPARRVTIEGREGEGAIVLGRRTANEATPEDRYAAPATVEMDAKDAALADAIEAGAFE